MDTNDLIYLVGELYIQRREQQMENNRLLDEIDKYRNINTPHTNSTVPLSAKKVSEKEIE